MITLAWAEWAARCLGGLGGQAGYGGGHEPGRLPAGDVAALAAELRSCTLPPGDVAFPLGGRPEGAWIIRSGAVELAAGRGSHPLVTQVLRSGDVFGDLPLLTGLPPPYRPRAVRETACLLLPAAALDGLLGRHPAIARLWLSGTARRLAASEERILALLDGNLPQRAAALLLREARDGIVDLSQGTLAAMLGTPRPSLNRVLRRFESAAILSLRYRQARILRPDKLAAIARSSA